MIFAQVMACLVVVSFMMLIGSMINEKLIKMGR